jgi:hypothetical protein
MNSNRQKLIHAITNYEYDTIASYLDDDSIHCDQRKPTFMKNFTEMLEMILEREGSKMYVCDDIDLSNYAAENHYSNPVFFRINEGYFILDIYTTTTTHFCIDICEANCRETDLCFSYGMDIYDEERVSFVGHKANLEVKASMDTIFSDNKTNGKNLWEPTFLKEWLKHHQATFTQLNNYHNSSELKPYYLFYYQVTELSYAYENYDFYKEAIKAYSKVDYKDQPQNYNWVEQFDGLKFTHLRSCDFILQKEVNDYFLLKPSIPNQYFLLNGYEQLIPYLNLNRVAYCVSLEYRGLKFQEDLQNYEEE